MILISKYKHMNESAHCINCDKPLKSGRIIALSYHEFTICEKCKDKLQDLFSFNDKSVVHILLSGGEIY